MSRFLSVSDMSTSEAEASTTASITTPRRCHPRGRPAAFGRTAGDVRTARGAVGARRSLSQSDRILGRDELHRAGHPARSKPQNGLAMLTEKRQALLERQYQLVALLTLPGPGQVEHLGLDRQRVRIVAKDLAIKRWREALAC